MREEILSVKKENPSFGYKRIAALLGCSPNTVRYHLDDKNKKVLRHRQSLYRRNFTEALKQKHGGKCRVCGYSKSSRALHFHHLDPAIKVGGIGRMKGHHEASEAEAKKCILICANCHAEHHDGLIPLTEFSPLGV